MNGDILTKLISTTLMTLRRSLVQRSRSASYGYRNLVWWLL